MNFQSLNKYQYFIDWVTFYCQLNMHKELFICKNNLDHSIHTMRLWAAVQAKSLCTDWNMLLFFKVVYSDVNVCLEQLQELRVPEMASCDSLEVLVQVCVALRAKLVSEIKVNIGKLKVSMNITSYYRMYVFY